MDLNSCVSNITRSEPSNALGLKTHFILTTNISWFERADCLDFVFFLILVTFPGNSQNHGFSIEHSEATVRDIDPNPCALDSSRSEVSDAQGLEPISCKPCPLGCKFGSIVCFFYTSGSSCFSGCDRMWFFTTQRAMFSSRMGSQWSRTTARISHNRVGSLP